MKKWLPLSERTSTPWLACETDPGRAVEAGDPGAFWSLSEGVLGAREGAVPDVSGVSAGSVQEHTVEVGVLLHEPGEPPGIESEGVLPDQDLRVAVDAGADAFGVEPLENVVGDY